MVLEMAGHGDLLEYVKLRGALAEEKARRMFSQLLSAVEYMHSFQVVHRDLKCENVLLDVENNVKLSDFGFSRIQRMDQLSKTYCGSAAYASPEVLQGIPYNGMAYDVWSLGVILYIMVCGSMPYDDTDVKKMIKYQTERKVGFSRHKKVTQDVKDLIHSILEANVARRYTVRDIVYSVWMVTKPPPTTPPPQQQQQPVTAARATDGHAAINRTSTQSLDSLLVMTSQRQRSPPVAAALHTDVIIVDDTSMSGGTLRPETPVRTSNLLSFAALHERDLVQATNQLTLGTGMTSQPGGPMTDSDHGSSKRSSPLVEMLRDKIKHGTREVGVRGYGR